MRASVQLVLLSNVVVIALAVHTHFYPYRSPSNMGPTVQNRPFKPQMPKKTGLPSPKSQQRPGYSSDELGNSGSIGRGRKRTIVEADETEDDEPIGTPSRNKVRSIILRFLTEAM